MTAMIQKIASVSCAILILTGCSDKVVYVDKVVRVDIPVKCNIPDVNCSFNKPTDTEVIDSLLECIIDLKKSIEVCK